MTIYHIVRVSEKTFNEAAFQLQVNVNEYLKNGYNLQGSPSIHYDKFDYVYHGYQSVVKEV